VVAAAEAPRRGDIPRPPFGHGEVVRFGDALPTLVGCFHPSRQNTNNGKLTAPMMESVFRKARRLLETDR
jgi:uracil-DNA glycosylase